MNTQNTYKDIIKGSRRARNHHKGNRDKKYMPPKPQKNLQGNNAAHDLRRDSTSYSRIVIYARKQMHSPMDEYNRLRVRYHEQVLNHTNIQFWLSIVCISVFVGWLILISMFADTASIHPILRFLPGVVIPLCLRQLTKMLTRFTKFYDKLWEDDKKHKAMILAESIKDSRMRDTAKVVIITDMLAISSSVPSDDSSVASRPSNHKAIVS